jgi:hypothetical protein
MPKFDVALNQENNDLLPAVINFNGSGTTVLVAGVASQIIRVWKLFLMVGGATNLTFQNGTTALCGPLPFLANMSMVLDFDTKPWFLTSSGGTLNLNSSNGVQVSGEMFYTQR